jgi:ornithine carbamoyltransferase
VFKLATKHFLTGEELSRQELEGLLDCAMELKRDRDSGRLSRPLAGKHLALLFEKPSLRTRASFTVAMQELGGMCVESLSSNSKKEEPEDVARVLAGYVHAIMVRTHEQSVLDRMASRSPVPVINGLSDTHHPCQTLADLLTLKQKFGKLAGLKVAYVGDGNNILHSLLLLAPLLGIHVAYACPEGYEPSGFVVKKAHARARENGATIHSHVSPKAAVVASHAVYTDVWVSMGFEKQEAEREKAFEGYQVNDALLAGASPNVIALHCLPMIRGKEITDSVADGPRSALFAQSENRLHAQKALLLGLLGD